MNEIPVSRNQILNVEIIDLINNGMGLVKIDGYSIFVKNALPLEKLKIKITEVKKTYALAETIEILKASPHRVIPKCKIYDQCGGCNLQHLDYQYQLIMKTNFVKEQLLKISKLNVIVNDCIGMEDCWKYRNKTQVPFGVRNNKVIAGFYKENTHEIIDMDRCEIQDALADEIVNFMKTIAQKYKIPIYNELEHIGNLRHVIIRKAQVSNEYMVTLVTKEDKLKNEEKIISELINRFPQIKSIVQNINPKKTNTILGDYQKVLYGKEYIIDYIGDVKFAISSKSFYQVNPVQTKVLYDQVLKYANLTGNETIIDAYCGIGTIGLYLAKQAKAIYGVEIVSDAIKDARLNAKLNNFTNAYYEVGKAEEIIKKWQKEKIEADIIIVDPPRKGCDSSLLNTIKEMNIPRMIYVSCDPATLARDLKNLSDTFDIIEVQPVDMFPHTSHVECVVLMSRVEK